jgi:hypothetical protein
LQRLLQGPAKLERPLLTRDAQLERSPITRAPF